MPRDELCSFCYTAKIQLMQSTAYSTYDDNWKDDLEYAHATCGVSGETDVAPPLVELEPEAPVLCISDATYTTVEGDTCDSIALAHNVASAALYMGNVNIIRACNGIAAGLELCLPLTCPLIYELQPNDTCTSIDAAQNLTLGDVRRYNSWLNLDCPNLQVASAVLGHVLCLGPQGANVTTTATIAPAPTSDPGANGDGYTTALVDPPADTEVAKGTTLRCGRWTVVQESDGITCAGICIRDGITSALFLAVNPSLSTVGCTSSLVFGVAYCTGPLYQWSSASVTMTNTSEAAAATATA